MSNFLGTTVYTYFYLDKIRIVNMAESDWDTVTVLRKKGSAAQSKSKQVS